VDDDGQIYASISGAITRVEFGEDAHWRLVPVLRIPVDSPLDKAAQFHDTWLWFGGSRTAVAWRPGQPLQTATLKDAVDRVFSLDGATFVSSSSVGSLYRLQMGGSPTLLSSPSSLASDTVTCSAPFKPHQLLVGTIRAGLRVFDGTTFRDIPLPKMLGPGTRINDICQVGEDFYAAVVDAKGIIFLDRECRIVQVLDRMLDPRLAQVRRVRYSSSGVLWALLDNEVACVQFPSPISRFEPVIASVMNYARPMRNQGRLWMFIDGLMMRGSYDADGRLESFKADTPPGHFLWSTAEIGGELFATTDTGIFKRMETGWSPIATGMVNARLGVDPIQPDGGFFYAARGEIGWIRRTAGGYAAERIPVNDLGEIYNLVEDSAGCVSLELGINRVGRVEFAGGSPKIRIFGLEDGLLDGWPNIFVLDGIARYSLAGHVLRFDRGTQRFVDDRELINRIPALAGCTGRPIRDASGRLWFSSRGDVNVIDEHRSGGSAAGDVILPGFQATEFTMEANGVVWMQVSDHLLRFDPRIPDPPANPLHAQITSVQLTGSNRRFYAPGPTLLPLAYADNSLVMRFAAPGNPFGAPVSFEIMIEGATDHWATIGTVGSASFNHLKEGAYVFRVRPVAGGIPGAEARLAFTVRPPWFRTRLAWVLYVLGAVGCVVFAAWLSSYLERREKERLERVVVAVQKSESRYRALFENIPVAILELDLNDLGRTLRAWHAAGVRDLSAHLADHPGEIAALSSSIAVAAANETAVRLTRADSKGHLQSEIARLFNPQAFAVLLRWLESIWQGRNDGEGEAELGDFAGGRHYTYMRWWMPRQAERLHLEHAVVALVDLTELKRAEAALAAEKERLTVTLRAMAEGVITTDTRGVVQFINRAAEELTQCDAAEAVGRPIAEVCVLRGQRSDEAFVLPLDRVLEERALIDLPPQTRLVSRNGASFQVEGCCAPVHDSGSEIIGTVLVIRDVTVRQRFEQEMERTSQLESLGILAGGIAHDFNNILTAVMGNITMAMLDAGGLATVEHYLQEAERATLRARGLTQQLLTFAKGGDPVRTAVLLPEIIREVAEFALHGSRVKCEFDLPPGLWPADADKGQLGQVVQNLVINAVQAMPEGGTIRIGASNETVQRDTQRPFRPGDYVHISVADTGMGIKPEHLAKIFDPYFTTKQQGSGLGLTTVYSIIHKHEGHIDVESEPGHGTTFHLWLRALREKNPGAAEAGGEAATQLKGRVLFMDDEESIVVMAGVLLRRLGMDVELARDGAEAVQRFSEAHAAGRPFDLVVMDLTVPGGVGGREAIDQLRRIDPDVRAIVSSGYSSDPVLANYRAYGFRGMVAKPYKVDDFVRVLRTALLENRSPSAGGAAPAGTI
jgi:PAS domain S-box-containing protein